MDAKEYTNLVSGFDDSHLIKLKMKVDAELDKRGISFNVGTLGEKFSIEYFNSTPRLPNLLQAPAGAKNVDALSREGDRYSIKSFMKDRKSVV